MSRDGCEEEANNAKIYVGEKLCGTLPAKVEKSKLYTFDCETVGNFVKIFTGRDDGKLTFANLEVYAINKVIEEEEPPEEIIAEELKHPSDDWRPSEVKIDEILIPTSKAQYKEKGQIAIVSH